jgi:hypothetical protein
MGVHLDIDDVCSGNILALEQLTELRQQARRYEIARRMNPRAWQEAFELCIQTGKPFDEIIDQLAPFMGVK